MVRDVYAADDASPAVAGNGPVRAKYRVLIDLDPTGVSRVVHQFALSNLAPTEVHCVRVDADSIEVVASMEGLSVAVAEFIRRKLLQLTCVFEADCRIEPLDAAPQEVA